MAEMMRIGEMPNLLGSTAKIDFSALKKEREKWLETNKSRLIEEYGLTEDFSADELLKIREYENSAAICEKCNGLPCLKRKMQTIRQTLKIDVPNCSIYQYESVCRFEKARRNAERIKRIFKSAKISTGYLNKTFEDYEVDANNKNAVQTAKNILQGRERGAYFYGAFGAGKTFLAAIIANEFVKKGVSVLFYKVPFLVKDLQDALFDDSDKFHESTLMKQIREVPVLILDDFGMSGKVSTYAAGRLSMIIDARYENSELATIITSNLSLKALQEKLDNPSDATDAFTLDGSRIADRVKEMCAVVSFGGESRRCRK